MASPVCASCEFKNRPENQYCTNCGKKLVMEQAAGPTLVMLDGAEEAVYQLDQKRSTIGRDRSNEVILDDTQISKEHASIVFDEGTYWIEDLDSKNGIYVNGRKIASRERLINGSLVKFGSTIMRFESP